MRNNLIFIKFPVVTKNKIQFQTRNNLIIILLSCDSLKLNTIPNEKKFYFYFILLRERKSKNDSKWEKFNIYWISSAVSKIKYNSNEKINYFYFILFYFILLYYGNVKVKTIPNEKNLIFNEFQARYQK
jgi:hypothetical protein